MTDTLYTTDTLTGKTLINAIAHRVTSDSSVFSDIYRLSPTELVFVFRSGASFLYNVDEDLANRVMLADSVGSIYSYEVRGAGGERLGSIKDLKINVVGNVPSVPSTEGVESSVSYGWDHAVVAPAFLTKDEKGPGEESVESLPLTVSFSVEISCRYDSLEAVVERIRSEFSGSEIAVTVN
jgi:hypothetical protein